MRNRFIMNKRWRHVTIYRSSCETMKRYRETIFGTSVVDICICIYITRVNSLDNIGMAGALNVQGMII